MLELQDFPKLYKNAKPQEEDTFDVSFEQAVTLVEQEDFDQALPLIEKIFQGGCLDIRLIMYRLFAEFTQQGPKSFTSLFPFIVDLIDKHWEKISPTKLREKYTFNSLVWFFSSVTKKLKRSHELHKGERPDELWKLAQKTLNKKTIESIEKEIALLSTFFSKRWEQTAIHEHILYIKKWLMPFKLLSPPDEEVQEEEASSPSEEELPVEQAPPPQPENPPSPSQIEPPQNHPLASKEMEHLIQKLETFQTLIEAGEMTKAALISDDIRTIVEEFNPTLFFPKLFGPYLSLVAKHIDSLMAEWEQKGSPRWDSLKDLYQTDIGEFLQW